MIRNDLNYVYDYFFYFYTAGHQRATDLVRIRIFRQDLCILIYSVSR